MKYIILIVASVLLTGCFEENKQLEMARGELRYAMFTQCLELAAKIERKGDDDVSDLISECGSQAFRIARHRIK